MIMYKVKLEDIYNLVLKKYFSFLLDIFMDQINVGKNDIAEILMTEGAIRPTLISTIRHFVIYEIQEWKKLLLSLLVPVSLEDLIALLIVKCNK